MRDALITRGCIVGKNAEAGIWGKPSTTTNRVQRSCLPKGGSFPPKAPRRRRDQAPVAKAPVTKAPVTKTASPRRGSCPWPEVRVGGEESGEAPTRRQAAASVVKTGSATRRTLRSRPRRSRRSPRPGPANSAARPDGADSTAAGKSLAPKPVPHKSHPGTDGRRPDVPVDKFLPRQQAAPPAGATSHLHQAESLKDEADTLAAEREPGECSSARRRGGRHLCGRERELDLVAVGAGPVAVDEIDARWRKSTPALRHRARSAARQHPQGQACGDAATRACAWHARAGASPSMSRPPDVEGRTRRLLIVAGVAILVIVDRSGHQVVALDHLHVGAATRSSGRCGSTCLQPGSQPSAWPPVATTLVTILASWSLTGLVVVGRSRTRAGDAVAARPVLGGALGNLVDRVRAPATVPVVP